MTDAAQKSYSNSGGFKTCKGPKCNRKGSHTSCVVCNSTEDVICATNPSLLETQKCNDYRDQCFTLISLDEVVRGCLNEQDEQFQNECKMDREKCEICPVTTDDDANTTTTNECNNKPVNVVDTCIECDSQIDERCRTNPDEMSEKICDKFRPSSQKACYLSIVSAHSSNLSTFIVISCSFIG